MKMRDIARSGLKGRKRDTFILKLVITLAFIFIITATIYQSSTDKTKAEQRYDLYGKWQGAYLDGNDDIIEQLRKEDKIQNLTYSNIIGASEKCGLVGTFNQKLIDIGRMSLYKGEYPKADNEIMVELNQMSNMNLELEVGQKVSVAIDIITIEKTDSSEYILGINKKYSPPSIDEYIQMDDTKYHETPFEVLGDITLVVSSNFLYYYPMGTFSDPETIRENGFITHQKVTLKKDFIITGILDTYSDKWDLGGHSTPNAFITEEAGKKIVDAFYNNQIMDAKDYEFSNHIFFNFDTLDSFEYMKDQYLRKEPVINYRTQYDPFFWMMFYGLDEKEIKKELEFIDSGKALEEYNKSVEEIDGFWRSLSKDINASNEVKAQGDTLNFRRNKFSYPYTDGTTEYILSLTIVAVIFLATACAVFQIFITQVKRRARKIVLLKSMGATNGQIVKIITWEGVYLLRSGLIFGISLGFLTSFLTITILNRIRDTQIMYYVSCPMVILGVLTGCIALFVGMIVPIIFAVRIPLLGTMSKPPRHKTVVHHKEKVSIKGCKQNLETISWRYFQYNKGKTLLPFGLSVLIISILLTSVVLVFFSFQNYIKTVIVNQRPDYAIEAIYGEMQKKIGDINEELSNINGITEVTNYKAGKQLLLWYEGIKDNPLLNTFKNLLPNELLPYHFAEHKLNKQSAMIPSLKHTSEQPQWIREAFISKIYGIDPEDDLLDKYKNAITVGNIQKEKFIKGEEVILLIPLYLPGENMDMEKDYPYYGEQLLKDINEDSRYQWLLSQSNTYHITYNKGLRKLYKTNEFVKPGDNIHLTVDDEKIVGETRVASFSTYQLKVGGIIYYFPEEGIWPFSNNVAPYTVIGSYQCVEKLFPASKLGLWRMTLEQMKDAVAHLYPTKYGRTVWYLESDATDTAVLDAKLLTFTNNRGFSLYNYRESNEALFGEGLNAGIIIGLLGLTSSMIAIIILYNTLVSKAEQEQNRIGILQSIGVTRDDFTRHYLKVGIAEGFFSLIIANLVIFLILLFTSFGDMVTENVSFSMYLYQIFMNKLYLYPWKLHGIICIIFFLLILFIHYHAGNKITKLYPIENIRSLTR